MAQTAFTYDRFEAWLKSVGMERLAYLLNKYPDSDERRQLEALLPKIGARLREKGLLPEDTGPELTEAEKRALPYLERLDAALKRGGHDAAMATWTSLLEDPTSRAALLEVAL